MAGAMDEWILKTEAQRSIQKPSGEPIPMPSDALSAFLEEE